MFVDVGLVSLYTGLLCLDRRAVGQTLISQPIVAIPILGLCFHQLHLALLIGSVVQLFWMSSNLYGANIPQNDTLAAATAAGSFFIALRYNFIQDTNLWILAVMATSPIALLCKRVQEGLDRYNARYSNRALSAAQNHKQIRLFGLIGRALCSLVAVHAVIAFVVIMALIGFLFIFGANASTDLNDTMILIGGFILPAIALSVSLSMVRRRLYLALCVTTFFLLVAAMYAGRLLL